MSRATMKSYHKALLIGAALATLNAQQHAASKEKEEVKPATKTNRDWLVDLRKKNVETKVCRGCQHKFTGSRRRKFCTVCTPFEITKRLADVEARSLEVSPVEQRD